MYRFLSLLLSLLVLQVVSNYVLDRDASENSVFSTDGIEVAFEEPTYRHCGDKDYGCLSDSDKCLSNSFPTGAVSERSEIALFVSCNISFPQTKDVVEFLSGYMVYLKESGIGEFTLSELNVRNAKVDGPLAIDELTDALPSLVALRIADAGVERVILPGTSSYLNSLSIVMSNVKKFELPSTANHVLKVLDLSGNDLTDFPAELVSTYPAAKIDLRENPLECGSKLYWLLDLQSTASVTAIDDLRCGKSFNGKPALQVVGFVRDAEEECPRGRDYECECSVPYILPLKNGTLIPMVVVDCSRRDLTHLPASLPRHTTTLHMEHNKVTSLDGEVDLVNYTSLVNLHLDNNSISKIDHLQGTWFGENFRLLSLKGNRFETIPTHVFRTILSRNFNVHSLYFGSETWACDCQRTPDLQIFLADYQKLIKDLEDIRCGSGADAQNRGRQIAHLSIETMCQTMDEVHMLDILNAVMSVLIVVIAVKLTYDWYNYRKTNQIPWIARRMP